MKTLIKLPERSEISKDSSSKFEDISSEDDELSKDGEDITTKSTNAEERNKGSDEKSEKNIKAEIVGKKASLDAGTKVVVSTDKLMENESKEPDDKMFDAGDENQVDDGDLEDEETTERISGK